jgi:hypothetical protein
LIKAFSHGHRLEQQLVANFERPLAERDDRVHAAEHEAVQYLLDEDVHTGYSGGMRSFMSGRHRL